jgi:hypothetical protein
MAQEEQEQINIELGEDVAEGHYVNLAMIGHSHNEFVVDFIRMIPGLPKAKVKSRIILTPEHAKRLLSALNENIQKYEENFGSIKNEQAPQKILMNFGGTMGEA